MPLRLDARDAGFEASFQSFLSAKREAGADVGSVVAEILDAVRTRGDDALFEYTSRFDNVTLTAETVRFQSNEIADAELNCDADALTALRVAATRIKNFHRRLLPTNLNYKDDDGVIFIGKAMIGIPLGLMYSNAMEWAVHKYVLHGPGKKRGSIWSFHFHEHHRAARLHNHIDQAYDARPLSRDAQSKEVLALTFATLAHLPLFPIAPFFTGTVVYSAVDYYRKHKRAHLDTEWARTHLPWHYDHHMGPNQDANWCVTHP